MNKMKEQLEKNKLFEAIFHSISDGVIICDEHGDFVMWNNAATEIIGIGPENIGVEKWPEEYGLYNSEDGSLYNYKKLPLYRAILGEKVCSEEIYIVNKNNEGTWISVNAKPLRDKAGNHFEGGVVVFRDITNKKKREAELSLLQDAVLNSTEGLIITNGQLDAPGPKIVFVNDAICKLYGYSRQELIGETPRLFYGPKTNKNILKKLKDKLKDGKSAKCKVINYAKDGTECHVHLSINPLFDKEGNIVNYASLQTDIKKTVEELEIDEQNERQLAILNFLQKSIKKRLSEMDAEDKGDKAIA